MNDRIRQIRKVYRMTTQEFGSAINLSASSVTNLEKGVRNPTQRTISDICRVFLINEEWLLSGCGDMGIDNVDTSTIMKMNNILMYEDDNVKKAVHKILCLDKNQLVSLGNFIDTMTKQKKRW